MGWYIFKLTSGTNVCLPTDYKAIASIPLCLGSNKLCAINCSDDGFGGPYISMELICEMAQAINSCTESTNIRLRA